MSLSVSGSTSTAVTRSEPVDPPQAPVTTPAAAETKATSAGVGAAPSGFDAGTTSTTTQAAATPPPVRGTEVMSLLTTPEKVSAADAVRTATKVDSIVQAALPTERDAVRTHFEQASAADLDKAFTNVLTATQQAGTRTVELGPFTGHVSVAADGKVNGAPLASDRELAVAGELANLSQDDRRAQLRQVGVGEGALSRASDRALVRAFNEVELTRRFGGEGQHTLQLDTSGPASFRGGRRAETSERVSFEVGPGGTVGEPGKALGRPSSEAALRSIGARESAEWPAGRPEDRRVTVAPNESVKFATLVSLLEPGQARELRAAREYLTNDSINAAYDQFLAAKGTPGEKSFSFELDASRLVPTGIQQESGEVMRGSPVPSYRLTATMQVGADGTVNGKPVLADEVSRLASQTATLPETVKDLLLKNAGVSDEWLTGARAEKDLVLAQLRLASRTPGEHTIDLNFDRHDDAHSESGGSVTRKFGSLSVSADDKGRLDGKPVLADAAIATHATIDRLPMAEKRAMMAQLGLPQEAIRGISAGEAASLLTTTAMLTTQKGDHSFGFGVSGRPWQMGLRIGEGGAIEGVGAQRIPEQSFGREFFDFACTVVSIAFPPVAPIVGAVRTAVAYEQGQRGLGLFASAASAVAGLGDMAGATWAAAAGDFAKVVSAVNGTYQAAKTGDVLGGFSSLVSLASSVGDLSGTPIGSNFNLLETLGRVATGARSLINGDINGLAGQAFGAVSEHQRTQARQQAEDDAELRRLTNRGTATAAGATGETTSTTNFGLGTARLGDGERGPRLGTGDDGSSLEPLGPSAPAGSPADVRRVDNALDRLRPQTREDFDRAFAAASRAGESTFSFDMNDGRGLQRYTTGTREQVAANINGGSLSGYREFVRTNHGGVDSDAALAAYRNSRATATAFGLTGVTLPETAPVASPGGAAALQDLTPGATRSAQGTDSTPPIARIFSAIDSWKRVTGSHLQEAASALGDAFSNNGMTSDQRWTRLGEARDALVGAARDGLALPAANLTGVTSAIQSVFGVDLNRMGYTDLATGREASAEVSGTQRLIATLETALALAPFARSGVRAIAATGESTIERGVVAATSERVGGAVPRPDPTAIRSLGEVPDAFRWSGTEPVYRGDRVTPEVLRERGGFIRTNGNGVAPTMNSLDGHINPVNATINQPDQWLSTSRFLDAPMNPAFSGMDGYVYVIRQQGGADVNALFGRQVHGIEHEITYENVPWNNIVGWYRKTDFDNLGTFTRNPDYRP